MCCGKLVEADRSSLLRLTRSVPVEAIDLLRSSMMLVPVEAVDRS